VVNSLSGDTWSQLGIQKNRLYLYIWHSSLVCNMCLKTVGELTAVSRLPIAHMMEGSKGHHMVSLYRLEV
jgi:hypothetical protein